MTGRAVERRVPVDAEEAGFARFVEARERALQRTAWLLTGDWALAEDLVQTALVRAWPRWERILRRDDPEIYVRRVMLNTWSTWYRRKWRGERPAAAMPDSAAAGDIAAEVAVTAKVSCPWPRSDVVDQGLAPADGRTFFVACQRSQGIQHFVVTGTRIYRFQLTSSGRIPGYSPVPGGDLSAVRLSRMAATPDGAQLATAGIGQKTAVASSWILPRGQRSPLGSADSAARTRSISPGGPSWQRMSQTSAQVASWNRSARRLAPSLSNATADRPASGSVPVSA